MKAAEQKDLVRKTTATVQIYGTDYKIKGDAEPEYIRKLAAHVDGKMRDVAAISSAVQPAKVAILAAINMADDTFRMRDELERVRRDLGGRAAGLARRIEDALKADGARMRGA